MHHEGDIPDVLTIGTKAVTMKSCCACCIVNVELQEIFFLTSKEKDKMEERQEEEFLYGYMHGFGAALRGTKYLFLMEKYLAERNLSVHLVQWHIPSFAETTTTHSVKVLEEFFEGESQKHRGKKWDLVGSSYGSFLVATLSNRRPDLFNKLILLAPPLTPSLTARTRSHNSIGPQPTPRPPRTWK